MYHYWHDFFLFLNMDQKDYTDIIPSQQTGWQVNAQSEKPFADAGAALSFFHIAKERLLDVNHWQQMAGDAMAKFTLTDVQGNKLNRPAQKGDYFKIDIPGPGTVAGDGYDWVKIEALDYITEPDMNVAALRVRPTADPQQPQEGTAHFFSKDSTSTFMVRQEGNKVYASIHDRNAKPNTNAEHITDKVRNTAVATGAITTFAKLQWQQLVDGILKEE